MIRVSTLKLNLRLKLSDFINTDYEDIIMNKINDYNDELQFPFQLKLWYDNDDDISHKTLKSFMSKWESKLRYKTTITPHISQSVNDFTYFDVIPSVQKNVDHRFRFRYTYIDVNDISTGIDEFYILAKFNLSPKPPKPIRKQKRNDYEENSNSWK